MRITGRTVAVSVAWIAVGVLGAAAVTGVANAGQSGGTSSKAATVVSTADPSATASPNPGDKLRKGLEHLRGRLNGLGSVLHGELTVKDKAGNVQSVLVQTGSVTARSGSSFTVKSDDGFTLTWTTNTNTTVHAGRAKKTLDDVKVGVKVRVFGTTSGSGGVARVVGLPGERPMKPGKPTPSPKSSDGSSSSGSSSSSGAEFSGADFLDL